MIQTTGIHAKITFEAVNANSMRFLRVVLYTPRSGLVDAAPVGNMNDHADPDLYIIWFDKTVTCPVAAAATPGGVMTVKKKFKPYLKTLYDADQGVDVSDHPVWMLLLPSADQAVQASWESRLYFKDL